MTAEQQYCLRWNNHQRNLLLAFDDLLRKEEFTDVTLACDYGDAIKCHRMVLAACSPYFQQVFTDLPCHHPVVVLKDVKLGEMKAMLEYMYKGEVSIAQEGLAALLRMAEALCVKGLVEENRIRPPAPAKEEEPPEDHSPSVSTSNPVAQTPVHSSCHSSPPHSTNSHYKTHYNPYKTQEPRVHLPIWPVPGLPVPPAPITSSNHPNPIVSGCYDAGGADMSPLRRKKISSMMMNRDTPILRTVLGHGQPDSSQPVSLVCHADNADPEDRMKHMKNEPSEDAQSPYTDFSPANDVEEKSRLAVPSTSPPQSFAQDMRGVSSGIATYVPAQKPEWKRYKQYTRNDILSAIEAVRNGMSALQAARKYGVPSRTLYDKVKKLGITTSRPFKRGGTGCFPYGAGSPYESEDGPNNNNSSSLMEASTFLQHALENRGDEREALAAMAAAHAVAAGHSTSPNGRARSPSPSPTMIKYMRHFGMTPSPAPGSHSTNGSSERDHEDEQDQVEDLSVKRKEPTRVIVPPMNQVSAIRKKEEMLIDSIKEEARREVSMKCEAE